MRTKKLGVAGRFGARYGKRLKDNFRKIEKLKQEKWSCSVCMKKTVKRECSGIWYCTACGHRFTGKAYKPS
jgi:large subunit ribosomal protein L37Ae